jgi:hypothetical protein
MVGAVLHAVSMLHVPAGSATSSAWPRTDVEATGVFAGRINWTLEVVAALLKKPISTMRGLSDAML